MMNLDITELRNTYLSARASAELLRSAGETAKAARVDSLARLVAREIERRGSSPLPFEPPSSPRGRELS
ncbi:MAG: hypothetical protein LC732_13090 [Acidobacteria bacterium]|nr:hypothetical protein [Acidobacteriota bacterium]